jgi:hypothetical protein
MDRLNCGAVFFIENFENPIILSRTVDLGLDGFAATRH